MQRSFPLALFLALACSCGDDKSTEAPPPDTTAPAATTDLRVENPSGGSADLVWTAPGDDGESGRASLYALRYAASVLGEGSWAEAESLTVPFSPGAPGEEERIRVEGFGAGTWYFALKTGDEVPNWSPVSNAAALTVTNAAPDAIDDLAAISDDWSKIALLWTAPGDDGSAGSAAQYDLRYSLVPINDVNWEEAEGVEGLPVPASAGTVETFTVSGLEPATEYHFAIKSADEFENWSSISNPASAPTASIRHITDASLGYSAYPSWSSQGESIAFVADWAGNWDIYRVSSDGGVPVRLTDDPNQDFSPSWSPDGTRLAFVSKRPTHPGPGRLWTMDSRDGSDLVLVADHRADIASCAWSPTGDYIAYEVTISMSPCIAELWVVSPEGGDAKKLVDHPSCNVQPAWSPDGSELVFVSDRGGSVGLWIVSLAGGEARLLYQEANLEMFTPSWSPDGSRVAFASRTAGGIADIYTISAAGGDLVRLTEEEIYAGAPDWSPDGRDIAFWWIASLAAKSIRSGILVMRVP